MIHGGRWFASWAGGVGRVGRDLAREVQRHKRGERAQRRRHAPEPLSTLGAPTCARPPALDPRQARHILRCTRDDSVRRAAGGGRTQVNARPAAERHLRPKMVRKLARHHRDKLPQLQLRQSWVARTRARGPRARRV